MSPAGTRAATSTRPAARPVPVQRSARGKAGAHQTPAERAARGRAARREVPRESHDEYAATSARPDPIGIIDAQSARRIQELIPIRYGRMSESPFRFYRGAAAIMASDLASTPQTGIRAQLCGDAHMLNFRLLASPERNLMFDINDFDETHPGPWEWDVKRLAASLVIAGRQNGFSVKERATIVRGAVRNYREAMRAFAPMGNLAVWYARAAVDELLVEFAKILTKGERKRISANIAKAKSRDSLKAFEKLTAVVGGHRQIVPDPPLIERVEDMLDDTNRDQQLAQLRASIASYTRTLSTDRRALFEQFEVADVARKVVGVGSVGTRCWIVLLLGRDDHDPLLLQIKEADTSVLAEHAGGGTFKNQGERVVAGQRLMQATSDIMLGWTHSSQGYDDGEPHDFYVRQLLDWKGIVVAENMDPHAMRVFAGLAGATLARAHARSGDRIAIAEYLGKSDKFDQALSRFAETYADQNERDHRALLDAVETGRVQAASTTP